MNVFRKIKLKNLGLYEFSENEKDICEYVANNFLNLEKYIFDGEYSNRIFYFKKDKYIFHINNDGYRSSCILLHRDKVFFGKEKLFILNIIKDIYKDITVDYLGFLSNHNFYEIAETLLKNKINYEYN